MYARISQILILAVGCSAVGCSEREAKTTNVSQPAFSLMSSDVTGIYFENNLTSKADLDVFRYHNYYNGGGVAIGDLNNDGLADIYFTSNSEEDKLYLNKGNWKFEDITDKAGLGGTKEWSTGVAMADVNGDGWLDIYVCNSGDVKGGHRENELFINNGNLTFTEKAKEVGLDDNGFATHAVFFDFDKDNDLDCFILNNSFRPIGSLGYRNLRDVRDEFGGHKLLRNDNGMFHDISAQAGIYGSVIGFGLGVTVGDVNNDGWPDLYVSNDFYERDYLYINKHDGTFSEELEKFMAHISMFSMGADMADINNDGYLDIFSTDMLPDDDYRLKKMTAFESYNTYQLRERTGFHHQFMRNMLQLNQDGKNFIEIGQMAGVDATDWSWGALIADFNNDGIKEIFVSNGIYKDVTDQDFIEYMGSNKKIHEAFEGKRINFAEFVDEMSSTKLKNFMFQHDSLMHFKNVASEWGIEQPGFSNGSAYGDLDNDGDLDLVINNLNMPSFVYQNRLPENGKNNSISLTFKGPKKNTFGIGTKIKIYAATGFQYFEQMPMRGFQSSMDYKMVIGLGAANEADSLVITWPDNKVETRKNIKGNQLYQLDYASASFSKQLKDNSKKQIHPLLVESKAPQFVHKENEYNDFDRERLTFHMLSTQGPALASGDVNGDGLNDLYAGGAKGQPGVLLIQNMAGEFIRHEIPAFQADSLSEDVDAIFFDADNDRDLDLYVVTSGAEYAPHAEGLQDHLYINQSGNGQLRFTKSNGLPPNYLPGSCVTASDIDHDGDADLFVGTRMVTGCYGITPGHQLLVNDGHGNFSEAIEKWYADHTGLGMITDAAWVDIDADGWDDLVVVGEWMPVTILKNDGQKLHRALPQSLRNSEGWWNTISIADINHDQKPDLLLGNLGWNSRFRPSLKDPVSLYVGDFDGDRSTDPIYTYRKKGKDFPYAMRQDVLKQMPPLKKKLLYFKDYAGKSVDEILPADQLKKATLLRFNNPSSSVLLNKGNLEFDFASLPWQAQVSPVYAIAIQDMNNDTHPDLVLGGNFFATKPEEGRYDALKGLVLLGDGKGNFNPLSQQESGLAIDGEIRRITVVKSKRTTKFVMARNNDSLKIFDLTK